MSDFGISKTRILQAYTGSYAGQYARDHGIPVENV